jgi:Cysteine dioxygenase type I
VDSRILPFLEEARHGEDWYVAHRHDAQGGSFSLQIFVWPPGTGIKIHDYSSWGAYCCAIGSVFEERYEHLDDSSRPDHARLKKVWQLWWSPEDGASTVLPGDGGIHRVGNPGASMASSVHFYGPQIGEVDGRDDDPSRDYVCDRRRSVSWSDTGTLAPGLRAVLSRSLKSKGASFDRRSYRRRANHNSRRVATRLWKRMRDLSPQTP